MGYVEVLKKKYDKLTDSTVAVYKITQSGFERLNINHICKYKGEEL